MGIERVVAFEAKAREEARAQEAKAREEARAQEKKVNAVVAEMRKDLSSQGNDALKELSLGGSKVDRIDRLLEAAQKGGAVEKILEKQALDARRTELLAMSKDLLFELCQQKGVDPLNKEVMVERIMFATA